MKYTKLVMPNYNSSTITSQSSVNDERSVFQSEHLQCLSLCWGLDLVIQKAGKKEGIVSL